MARKSAVVQSLSRVGAWGVSAGCPAAFLGALWSRHIPQAALADGGKGRSSSSGSTMTDRTTAIQGRRRNQSLDRTDVLTGGQGNDVLFGLNGSDVIDGGQGQDIILGGPDAGAPPGGPPNSDIMFGGPDDDVNLWAPGDGSEVFAGGPGNDALIFGATDREVDPDPATGVRLPTLLSGVDGFPQGIPTANVSGLTNFCTVGRALHRDTTTWSGSVTPQATFSRRCASGTSNRCSAAREAGSRLPTCRNRRRGSASSRRPRFRR